LQCFEVEHDTTGYPAGLQVLVGTDKVMLYPSLPPLIVQFVALKTGPVNAFISCAHRRLQLLVDATTGHVGESKRLSAEKPH
jgi:hypothetical protein